MLADGEAELKKHSMIVHSQEELDALGSDWGSHPAVR